MTVLAGLKVVNAGMHSIVVDKPRFGYARLGITQSGAMDELACLWANWLCGNQSVAASLELLGAGQVFEAQSECLLAITGAATQVRINHRQFSSWQSFRLVRGDLVEILPHKTGLRTYLAVNQGFDIAEQFSSSSTCTREKLGGLDGLGSILKHGDLLPTKAADDVRSRLFPQKFLPLYSDQLRLRVVIGYQAHEMSNVFKAQFFTQKFTLSHQSDRMGIRLSGNILQQPIVSMLSEGVCRGAVQIPPDGQPIIMINDRQTIGGYPKIGSVLSLDCNKLAQAPPGTHIAFTPIDEMEAHNALHMFEYQNRQIRHAMKVDN